MSVKLPTTSEILQTKGVSFGLLITAIGGLLFSFDLPLLRLAATDKWTMIFCRGLMLFISISITWYLVRKFTGNKTPYIAGAAGLAVVASSTVANMTYIAAAVETHPANVVFIIALIPILTAIFSWIFLKEQVHKFTWAAALISFGGVAIIVNDGLHTGMVYGDLLAFVSACCTAASFTIARASGKNVATSLALGSLLAALIAFTFFPIDFSTLLMPAGFGVLSIVWLGLNGLIAIPLASILIANGPRYLPAVDVSMFFMLETVLTPVWIWFLFGSVPCTAACWGGFIIVVTLIAHSYWRLQESSRVLAAETNA